MRVRFFYQIEIRTSETFISHVASFRGMTRCPGQRDSSGLKDSRKVDYPLKPMNSTSTSKTDETLARIRETVRNNRRLTMLGNIRKT